MIKLTYIRYSQKPRTILIDVKDIRLVMEGGLNTTIFIYSNLNERLEVKESVDQILTLIKENS